jgi:hypothetical protein
MRHVAGVKKELAAQLEVFTSSLQKRIEVPSLGNNERVGRASENAANAINLASHWMPF